MFSIFSTGALRRAATLCGLAVLATAQACGGDSSSSTSPRNSDSGPPAKYLLRTVDGHSLPYQISRSPYYDATSGHFYNELDVTVTGGAWDLDELGFADFYVDFSVKGDGVQLPAQHKEAFGTYEVQGSQVFVTFGDAGSNLLPIQNGQIEMPLDFLGKGVGNDYVFRR